MSLKGVELQIAIPKSFDAGKLSDQKQQRTQVMQDHANLQTEKQAEQGKETVLEAAHYQEISEDEHAEQERQQQKHQSRAKQDEETIEKSKHPYKGSFVDFSR